MTIATTMCLVGPNSLGEDDRDYLTVRYYLSLKINRPAENDFPLFWGYVLWQEHLNYDAFWQDGELQWDEYREVLVIDSYVDKWRWIRPDGKENWDAERRFSTLRLLQADWERKRQELGYDRLWSFQHRHHTIDKSTCRKSRDLFGRMPIEHTEEYIFFQLKYLFIGAIFVADGSRLI